ncbi:sodium transport system permease protein [Hathewaya proteolytica DSM 3090]|uniref:Sodium transport system permease protein n=1 Tax=Hathewaya proteolytica DSM 3090 TaxID=1121331 RepID=A0A1M6R597_9CLOT|nr:ABC transporter permease [Hathewaya proteolytica]SHK27596.1 sodium transport system permease protein [Hathewaya proteolytica DSM 3090]
MSTVGIVLKKEIIDMFRDKKTIIMSIVIPLVIYPVLFAIMSLGMDSQTKDVTKEVKMVLEDKGNTKLGTYIKQKDNIKLVNSKDGKKSIEEGTAYIYMVIPEDVDTRIEKEEKLDISIFYDGVSSKCQVAMEVITAYFRQYSDEVVKKRLESRNINADLLTPINLNPVSINVEKDPMGKMMMGILLPMMILTLAASAPITSAVDLCAGEKERGTLEPLLTTQASRLSLLWGKYMAIIVMGMLGTLSSMVGLVISGKSASTMLGGILNLTPATFILIAVIIVGVTMMFAALALAISIYARSFKEAQTYVAPLTFVSFIGFVSYFIDVKTITLAQLNIPIYNVVALLKEVIMGVFNPLHIAVVLVWLAVYILASIFVARYVFGKESAIFRC